MDANPILDPDRDPLRSEPDYRFTFANERTFLAWIRTALALDAAGLAIVGFLPPSRIPGAREAFGLAFIALGTFLAVASYRRWERDQERLRRDAPLEPSDLPRLLAVFVAGAAVVGIVLAIVGPA